MAAGPQADDIADLVLLTLKDLGRGRWTEIATTLQEHVAMNSLLRKERTTFGSGYGIQFNVMKTTSGASENQGLFEVDTVNVGDVMATGTVPWRHTTTNWAIEKREIAMNRSPARLVELVKIRKADGMIDLSGKMENNFWNDPTDDGITPFGIDYWIQYNATDGFNGGNPTSFTGGAAGIDVADIAAWKNYTGTFTNVTKADLVRVWRKAATFVRFMPPAEPNPDYSTGHRYGYYTNYNVIGPLEEALESQNQNLGNDVASKDGRLIFRLVPVTWVPKLEGNAVRTDPVYGIDWGTFKIAFLRGEYLRQTGPQQAANQHNVLQTHVDLTYNFVAYDRRRLMVIAKS